MFTRKRNHLTPAVEQAVTAVSISELTAIVATKAPTPAPQIVPDTVSVAEVIPSMESVLGLQDFSLSIETEAAPAATPDGKPKSPPFIHGGVVVPFMLPKGDINIIEHKRPSARSNYTVLITDAIRNVSYESGAPKKSREWDDIARLIEEADETQTFTFWINSPGGMLHVATPVCEVMRRTKAHTVTIAIGAVASAAALMWCYGKERRITPAGSLLFHMSSHGDMGNTVAIANQARTLWQSVCDFALLPFKEQGLITDDEYDAIVTTGRDVIVTYKQMSERLKAYDERMAEKSGDTGGNDDA